jgi:hypothetical protein
VSSRTASPSVFDLLGTLWDASCEEPFADLLPRDRESLARFYERLRAFVESMPGAAQGRIDPGACVEGEIVSMGPGSVMCSGRAASCARAPS